MLRQIAVHRAEFLGPWKHLGKPFVLYAFVAILAPAVFLSANVILHHRDGSAAQPAPYESPPPPKIGPTKATPDLEPASILMSQIEDLSRELQELRETQAGLSQEVREIYARRSEANERLISASARLSLADATGRQTLGDQQHKVEDRQRQILALQQKEIFAMTAKLHELAEQLAAKEFGVAEKEYELAVKQAEFAELLSDLRAQQASQPLQQSTSAPGGLAKEPISGPH